MHSDINLGGQGTVITNQGVAIQPCFSSKTTCSFETGQWVVVQSLPGGPDRGTVLRVWGRGTDPRSLVCSTARRWVLPRSHRDLRRVQTNTQSRKRNKSFIIELELETIKIWRYE